MKNYLDATGLGEFAGQLADKLASSYAHIFATKGEVGSPLSAATAADMTDTDRVYVYTGDETGYTAGDWYYYDGSDWVSGGVYNSVAVETDPTLAVEGMAADAKAAGDALATKLSGTDTTLTLSGMAADGKAVGDALATKLGNTNTSLSTAGAAADAKASGEILAELRALGLGTMSLASVTITNWANRKVNDSTGSTSADNKYIYGRFSGTCDYVLVTGIPSGVDCALYGYACVTYQAALTYTYAGLEGNFGETQTTGTRIFRVTKGIAFALSCKNRNGTNIATSVGEGLTVYLVTAVTQAKEAAEVPDILTHTGTIIGKQFAWELGKIDTDGSVPDPPSTVSSDKASWKQIRTAAYDCTPGDTFRVTSRGITNEALIACMYYYDADAGTYTMVRRLTSDDAKEFVIPPGVNKIRFSNGRANAAGDVYMADPMDFINAFKVTVTMESINDYLRSIGYIPIPKIIKGSWQKGGSVSPNTKGISVSPKWEGMTPGTVIDVRITGDWCYSVWSGNTATNLTQDYRLVQYSQFVCKRPVVAISFYRMVDGVVVDTAVSDYNGNFLLFEHGSAVDNDEWHEIPENLGVINVINRAYQMCKQSAVAADDLPTDVDTTQYPHYFPEGTLLKGTIYSSVRRRADYVPQCVNWQAYFTSILNPKSYIYTKAYTSGTDYNCRTYYGAVCSSMVAYCYGFEDVIPTTYTFHSYDGMEAIVNQSPYGLKLGDCLSNGEDPDAPHHIVIVTDIVKNTRGYIQSIEVCSQQNPWCTRRSLTADEVGKMFAGTSTIYRGIYKGYRYAKIYNVPYTATPWINLDEETGDPVYPTIVLPLRGDTSNWYAGEDVEIYYDNTGDTTHENLVLTNLGTGTSVDYPITAVEDVYTLTGLSAGRYSVSMGDETAYFDVLSTSESYAVTHGEEYDTLTVNFDTHEENAMVTPTSVILCEASSSDTDYRAVQAYHVFTEAEASAGTCAWDRVPSGTYLASVFYKTEYGLFRSESMQSVTI